MTAPRLSIEQLTVEYAVVHSGGLTADQFTVLRNHFEKLGLADRYARQASTVLAKLVRQFRTPRSLALGRRHLRQRLNQLALDRAAVSTPNHWEAILMENLAATDDFTDHIFN